MGEFKKFIKDLKKMGFGYVGMEEVFGNDDDNAKLIGIDEVINIVKELGVKELGDIYYEEISFITKDNKYIEVIGFC